MPPHQRQRPPRPEHARTSTRGMVCSVDHLASGAGITMLANGGSAVDAAVATSAVLAVTTQHMCGMGGDLWALVHVPGAAEPVALNASGAAGSGSDAASLRSEGATTMPFRGDLRSVPVPGCVDGWVALHDRFGRLPLADVLEPARQLAADGFSASPLLARSAPMIADLRGADDYLVDGRPVRTGEVMTRRGLAEALSAIGSDGRDGWYGGRFGGGLIELGAGLYTSADLERVHAEWVDPVGAAAFGRTLWTVPPNSQGYLSLAGAVIADGLDVPDDPDDPLFAHYLIESSKQAGHDRNKVLFDGADGAALVAEDRLGPRRAQIADDRAADLAAPGAGGGTIYLCAVDDDRMGVSLIQSNASGFGAHITVPDVGVFLHNRGIGFSLEAGHPAELAPGRRPPSTLSPALATDRDGRLRTVFGCMGGDAQPQVVLQLAARTMHAGQAIGPALTAPRFALTVPDANAFDTWADPATISVAVEEGSPWVEGLVARGHEVVVEPWGLGMFGHAHLIEVLDDHLAGVADPRASIGAALGR